MIKNKYTAFRKLRIRAFNAVPGLSNFRGVFDWLKLRRFRGRLEERRREMDATLRATGAHPLFHLFEIETVNRCNGECGFCPVNKHTDPRKMVKMSDELFTDIIEQLRELDFDGRIHLFSNNEPLLDPRMTALVEQTRKALPNAFLALSTNGLLLKREVYERLIESLDELTVNSYCADFRVSETHAEIQRWAASRPEWDRKTLVFVRYNNELMTTRGGNAPNRKSLKRRRLPVGCTLPTRQVVVRPDGKISLCCNDALGTVTLGDLSRDRLLDVWNGEAYIRARDAIMNSREAFPVCRECDTLQGKL